MAEMHSGIKSWKARASDTVSQLAEASPGQGKTVRISDSLHTLGFMHACLLHVRSLSAAPAPVHPSTASKDHFA